MAARKEVKLENIQTLLEKSGANFVLHFDEKYPIRLKSLHDFPPVLFYRGNLEVLSCDKCVAIVGTRNATKYGLNIAKRISSMLAKAGVVVVSGLAAGIDSSAHVGTLEIGKTIAVLGTGIDIIYPVSNERLVDDILKNKGLVISEYPPNDEYRPWNFPQRNRIISAISDAVIVVEGDIQSGALITARFAIKQGKPLFAVPGSVYSSNSNGPNVLIKSGVAEILLSIDDVLDRIGKNVNKQMELNLDGKDAKLDDLNNKQKDIVELLSSSSKSFECLLQEIKLDPKELITNLSILELKGLIEKTNSGDYIST